MPKVTIRAEFSSPVELVWRLVTDLQGWQWRSDIVRLQAAPDGMTFVEYARNGTPTYFRVTAFAPCRWYALDLANERIAGRWEGLFARSRRGGTKVEFTEELHIRNPLLELMAGAYLRRQQRRYIADLRRALGEE